MDVDASLIFDAGGEHFLGAGGNGGVARDNFRDYAAHRLDAQREWSDVKEQHRLDAAFEDVALYPPPQRDYLIGIQLAVRGALEVIAPGLAYERDARGAADEDDFVHFFRGELRIGEG